MSKASDDCPSTDGQKFLPLDVVDRAEGVPTQDPFAETGIATRKVSQNGLNDLSAKEWIQETITVWRQKGLGAAHPHAAYEKLHPAPFSFQDVARLIRFFTKADMLVLDPFAGVGSTLKAAAVTGRRGIGVELSPTWASVARQRLAEEVPGYTGQTLWCMDVRDALPRIADDSIDFIVTSPPYWAILNKKADHKAKRTRVVPGLVQNYSEDPNDLGNIVSYEAFLAELVRILEGASLKLRRGRYCAVIVSDFKHGSKYYPFHSDLYSRIDPSKLQLQGCTILHQSQKSVYPYGYPFAYVPNIHHQYILILRRPNIREKANGNGIGG